MKEKGISMNRILIFSVTLTVFSLAIPIMQSQVRIASYGSFGSLHWEVRIPDADVKANEEFNVTILLAAQSRINLTKIDLILNTKTSANVSLLRLEKTFQNLIMDRSILTHTFIYPSLDFSGSEAQLFFNIHVNFVDQDLKRVMGSTNFEILRIYKKTPAEVASECTRDILIVIVLATIVTCGSIVFSFYRKRDKSIDFSRVRKIFIRVSAYTAQIVGSYELLIGFVYIRFSPLYFLLLMWGFAAVIIFGGWLINREHLIIGGLIVIASSIGYYLASGGVRFWPLNLYDIPLIAGIIAGSLSVAYGSFEYARKRKM